MATVLRAWLRGLVQWGPPPALRSEYLIVWALLVVGLVFAAPFVMQWPTGGRLAATAGLVVLAGTVNAVFRRLAS